MSDSIKNLSLEQLQKQLVLERERNLRLEALLDLKLQEVCDLNNSLEHAVAERTQDLSRALKKAQELGQVKSQFLANMSHELRTPLNSILGLIQQIRMHSEEPQISEFALRIEKSGQRLLDHVDRIFDYSNLELASYSAHNEDFELKSLKPYFFDKYLEKALEKKLKLNWQQSDLLPEALRIDATALKKVVSILVENAIAYTNEGEISISVDRESNPLDGGDVLCVQVKDSGVGIAAESLATIFAPFSQGDNSDQRASGGVGLGLSLASRIALGLGAEIRVESQPGHGSIFRFWYPLSEKNAPVLNVPEAKPATERLRSLAEGLHVLTVDDDETNNILMSAILASMGVKTLVARNGQEALDLVAKNPQINLILMDCQMPVIDGLACTRELRQSGSSANIIAVTANGQPENRQNCFEVGMNGFLVKPISREKLAEAIMDSLWFLNDAA